MNIISQDFKNVLKIRLKNLINPILYNFIDTIVDDFAFGNIDFSKYLSMFSSIQSSTREIMKSIIVSTFEEIDNDFKNSSIRKKRYIISKSNVPRTLNTIIGTITFKRTYYYSKFSNKGLFYLDNIFDLPKYDHYDPIVKAISINNSINTSQAQASRDISSFIGGISYFVDKNTLFNIPRQSIFNWINNWKLPTIIPSSISTPNTLYVMADEKYIACQDLDKNIMIKSFVTFEDVKHVSKGRNELVNRFTFSTSKPKPWTYFMDLIAKRYDFSKINNICLLADGASWIKSGISELRLDKCNHVRFYLCEFHFKQAIHHITTDKNERLSLFDIFTNNSKKDFTSYVHSLIEKYPSRKESITSKLNYILTNYSSIKAMLELNIGSSMESHISHLIASFFSSRPKGYSSKRIQKYIRLNDYKNNDINIFNLYMNSYKNKKCIRLNENSFNFSIFEKQTTTNIPILSNNTNSQYYSILHNLAH